ncbi:hypothetical protein SAMN06297387_1253 [Streptomyces zhaozhouensis]|uniref:Uncharacterized protein n=1 Tax=Streptomyces zhaozhouensis TaxID=1300267 RepID=A0A286E5S3_9ACTN|nr:hypothetical protein [Streptomyces zhaozhouensis]SOD66250.1 hypothetical protein SAMN06297387_1253 [Streptomyces zhaozhouensis]
MTTQVTPIIALWKERSLPIHDGLYLATGDSYAVRLAPQAPTGVELLDPFDLRARLDADPEWVTEIELTRRLALEAEGRVLCCGDGGYGSEGFVACTDGDEELEWVMYFEHSNPFMDISWDATRRRATFTSTSDVRITVNALAPWWETAGS